MSPVRVTRVSVMSCASWKTWAAAVFCIAAGVSAGNGRWAVEDDKQFELEELSPATDVTYGNGRGDGHVSEPYSVETGIVRPVSYTYFSANIREVLNPKLPARTHLYAPPFDVLARSESEGVAPRVSVPVLTDNVRQQSHVAPYEEERTMPSLTRRTVRFPLNTVLPGNSLSFDHTPYPGLLQAVNTFSDLSPSGKPNEGVMVTHNTVSLPGSKEGITTASRTRITNHETIGDGGSYPYREFTETTHNTQGDRGRVIEKTRRFRVHHGLDEDPAESHAPSKTGRGDGRTRYESESGGSEESDHRSTKGGKGEKEYQKDHKYHKEGKGYHDKERDSSNSEEDLKKEKKYRKDEEFYGEHRKAEKGGKGKKYGEGGKHKKGHTTHGEHNIIKKDEFIKNTKFYDEDHGGGEHEEHGEFYGQHEEKQGGNKEGENKESNYEKTKEEKKKSSDKGREEEEQRSRETGSGREKHFEREEEYGGKQGAHTHKKWGNTIGDHR